MSIFVEIQDPFNILNHSILGKKIDFVNPHPKNPLTADSVKFKTKLKEVGDIQSYVAR
jgi:hypothetical protein